MKKIKFLLSIALCALMLINIASVAFAAETLKSSEKEEVIYINLSSDGSVEDIYAVNSFSGGDIVDYGNYSSVKNLNTNDKISQNGDCITFSSTADKVYYQGQLNGVEIPWKISLKYFIDGKEYTADEVAGKSGNLKIKFTVEENKDCDKSFFESYALQASFTLDTEKCNNIKANDATIANAGANKQLTYTILPGSTINTVITADVTNFEMEAVSINGIKLNLDVDIDSSELTDKFEELENAIGLINDSASDVSDGAEALADGSNSAKDGAYNLKSGSETLDDGISKLEDGISSVESGLKKLNNKSDSLTDASTKVKNSLVTIKKALKSVSVSSKKLSSLTKASGKIKTAISDLYDGATILQSLLGYSQYKAVMAQNGVDIDALVEGNSAAITSLTTQIGTLQTQLENVSDPEEYAEIKAQIEQLQQVVTLLTGNNAAIGGMEEYLGIVSGNMQNLTQGLSDLNTQYTTFDGTISELVNNLSNILTSMSDLSSGINTLTKEYKKFDKGLGKYTDGVSEIVTGYGNITSGVKSIAGGSKTLTKGCANLYDGTVELYDGSVTLWDGTKQLSQATDKLNNKTSGIGAKTENEIDKVLETINGNDEPTVSFVSSKNENVDSLQFVIKCKAIEVEQTQEDAEETEDESLNFWQKLLRLFGLY